MDHAALASRRLHWDGIWDNGTLGNGRGFACRLSKHLCQRLDGSESLKGTGVLMDTCLDLNAL